MGKKKKALRRALAFAAASGLIGACAAPDPKRDEILKAFKESPCGDVTMAEGMQRYAAIKGAPRLGNEDAWTDKDGYVIRILYVCGEKTARFHFHWTPETSAKIPESEDAKTLLALCKA
jgi:hypothetical protein